MRTKKIITTLLLLIFVGTLFAQRISSNKKSVSITNGEIKRGFPPSLYANLEYSDENGNGILESEEKSILTMTIFNKGKGRAQALVVTVSDDLNDRNLQIEDNIKIGI